MNKKSILPIKTLHKLLVCDAEEGKLYWRTRDVSLFKRDSDCASWNIKYAEKRAFKTRSNGYRTGVIFDKHYSAHRVIFAMHHDKWPYFIDHINHDRADNRINNLRDASPSENQKNTKMQTNNTSGYTGVIMERGLWCARITVDGAFKNLGRYKKLEDAISARKKAEKKYGFHANHGIWK